MRHRIIQILLLVTIGVSSHLVLAEENVLDPVIVTATRTAQTADQALASVTVITRKEIEKTQAKSVADLLRNKAGIHIAQSGGYGKTVSVYFRGTSSDHALVLIDGVRAASSTLGSFSWANFLPEQIERIEIVRGPRASLYGSDAIGGVVQIFTRHTAEAHISVSMSDNTNQVDVGFGGGENWKYSVEAGRYYTDGIPALASDIDDDGYDNNHVSMALSGKIAESGDLKLRLSQSEGLSELDPATGDREFKNRVFSGEYSINLTQNWLQKIILGNTLDESQSYSPTSPSTITTKRNSLNWQNDILFGEDVLTIGADYYKDKATKDNSGVIEETINNKAAYIQHQFKLFNSDWILGGRYDDHSEFGEHSTWNIAWGHDLSEKSRITMSYGEAFKAPTVNDLFWPLSTDVFGTSTFITQGNPNLTPEESNTFEIGIKQKIGLSQSISTNIFHTNVNDLIDWITTPTGIDEFTSTPTNTQSVTINGVEVVYNWLVGKWELNATASFLEAKDDDRQEQLDRRPEQSLSVSGSRTYNKHSFYAELFAASERLDRDGSAELAGYGVANLSYQLKVDGNLILAARIDNVFNQDYILATSFSGDWNVEDRNVYVSMHYKF